MNKLQLKFYSFKLTLKQNYITDNEQNERH